MKIDFSLVKIGLLLLSAIVLSVGALSNAAQESAAVNILYMESDQHSPEELKSIIESIPENTTLIFEPGNYVVDNPIDLGTNNVSIRGSDNGSTRFMPKNTSYPILRVHSENIAISQLTISGTSKDSNVQASQAIELLEGTINCLISDNNISNIASTSIYGNDVNGCKIIGNTITNSGGDAIRIVGNSIDVMQNTINRYFDEAIDLEGGEDFRVIENTVNYGRIGIVLNTMKGGVVDGNEVFNQLSEGIVCGSSANCMVVNNCVVNAGRAAFNLTNAKSVGLNFSHNPGGIGFELSDSDDTVIYKNIVLASGNTAVENIIVGLSSQEEGLHGDRFHVLESIEFSEQLKYSEISNKLCTDGAMQVKSSMTSTAYLPEVIGNSGEAEVDNKHLDHILELLVYYNPGFISISLDGLKMESEISQQMLDTMRTNGQKSIELVRAMYLRFSPGDRWPLWYLTRDKKMVAVVYGIKEGASVEFVVTEEGKLPFLTRIRILYSSLMYKLRDLYYLCCR